MYQSLKERGPSGGSFNERESYLFFTIPDQTRGVIQIQKKVLHYQVPMSGDFFSQWWEPLRGISLFDWSCALWSIIVRLIKTDGSDCSYIYLINSLNEIDRIFLGVDFSNFKINQNRAEPCLRYASAQFSRIQFQEAKIKFQFTLYARMFFKGFFPLVYRRAIPSTVLKNFLHPGYRKGMCHIYLPSGWFFSRRFSIYHAQAWCWCMYTPRFLLKAIEVYYHDVPRILEFRKPLHSCHLQGASCLQGRDHGFVCFTSHLKFGIQYVNTTS